MHHMRDLGFPFNFQSNTAIPEIPWLCSFHCLFRVTTELRERMAAALSPTAEVTKRHLREVRTAAMNSCSSAIKDHDVKRLAEGETQKLYTNLCKKVDEIIAAKKKEILS